MHSDNFPRCVAQGAGVLVVKKVWPDRSELGIEIKAQPPDGIFGNAPSGQIGPTAVPLAPGFFITKKKTYSFS
jgi:hypothetical protein